MPQDTYYSFQNDYQSLKLAEELLDDGVAFEYRNLSDDELFDIYEISSSRARYYSQIESWSGAIEGSQIFAGALPGKIGALAGMAVGTLGLVAKNKIGDDGFVDYGQQMAINNAIASGAFIELQYRRTRFPYIETVPLEAPALNYNGIPRDDVFGQLTFQGKRLPNISLANEFTNRTNELNGVIFPRCFPSGTTIQLSSGESLAIESLVCGSEIAAFDSDIRHGRSGLVSKRVIRLFHNITDTWIALSNGLTVTPGHHFLDAFGNFRTIADILATDSRIVLEDGSVAEVAGEYLHYSEQTAHLNEQAEGSTTNLQTAHSSSVSINPTSKYLSVGAAMAEVKKAA